MVAPVQSLMNMEMALYGGMGSNYNVPSFYNNYMGSSQWNSPSYNLQNAYNPTFTQQIPNGYANPAVQHNAVASQGLSQQQVDALGKAYAEHIDPTQSLFNAVLMGGVSGALMTNPRILAHPINTFKGFGDVKKMFSTVKTEGSVLNKLWKDNSNVMQEAYAQMHRASSRANSKLGLFRKTFSDSDYKLLKDTMQKALDSGDVKEIAKATESLKLAYVNDGFISRGWNKVSGYLKKVPLIGGFINDAKPKTVAEALGKTDVIAKNADELMKFNKMTLGKAFTKTGGWIGLAFGALEILGGLSKFRAAKAQDEENAKNGQKTNLHGKQVKQTVVKALANTVGYAAGETLGIWAFSKWGAAIGTAVAPGVGSAIGAVVGFFGGALGTWALGGLAKKLVGRDVMAEEEGKKKVQTAEGQAELLQLVAQKAQNGGNVTQAEMSAVQQIASNPQVAQMFA